MDKYIGKRLDGRYEIEEIIGVGGMAVVYKAYDNVQDRTVAIKILKDEYVSNEEFIRRFKNESKAIAILSHPNIVKVYDVSFGDLIQYIVMEYIDGITLKEYIDRQGSLLWKDTVYFTIQILKALGHAHDKGIVHRDVKPQNIMVLNDGTIKVTDFGIARFARTGQRTMTDKAIGSVHYISPEQARGEKTDEKADIYSVGVMLYEMLTGQLPFEADSAVSVAIMQLQKDPVLPTQINSSIPLGLEQITMKAMQKNPDRRYQAASEMLCDLDAFKKDPSITFDNYYFIDNEPTKSISIAEDAPPVIQGERIEKPQEKNSNLIPILSGIASALVVALIVVAVILINRFNKTGAEIACPDFVGKTKDEISQSEDFENFKIDWQYVSSDDYEIGTVCSQSQDKGKKLKKGANITLYVSTGKATVTVPDVYGRSESYAVSELKSKGLVPTIKKISSDTVEKDMVVKTEPERSTYVAEKAEIIVYISTGKEIKNIKVPDVVKKSSAQAEKELKEAGFSTVVQTRDLMEGEEIRSGYVVSQSPSSGETLEEGSTVIIYVSSGEYQYNITVAGLKTSYNEVSSGTLSIVIGGVSMKENSVNVNLEELTNNEYTFKFKSEKKEIDVKIMFNDIKITEARIKPSTTKVNCP